MDSIKVSVVVCTYNRCDLLGQCLEGLLQQNYPDDLYEILVIDNNSTDETPEVVGRIQSMGDKEIRYIKETQVGLSHARNRGILESQGEIIAFIDDDAIADKGWLVGLADVYSVDKTAACVGGKIDLLWPFERPAWFPRELESYLTALDYGPDVKKLEDANLYGCNFSIRRDVFDAVGLFRTDLGRVSKKLLSGEETELLDRIRNTGGSIVYTPDALVHHIVVSERVTKRFLKSRSYWQGVSDAIQDQLIHRRSRKAMLKQAFFLLYEVARKQSKIVRLRFRKEAVAFTRERDVALMFGYAWQSMKSAITLDLSRMRYHVSENNGRNTLLP